MQNPGRETMYYDGHCGLCHHAVQFVLKHDRDGSRFRFAPLDSDSFRRNIPPELRANLPDSVIVWTAGGQALAQSAAILHILARLGGFWRILAAVGRLFPARLLNWIYGNIAAIRHRLFAPPEAACPLMPKHLRDRFDL
jgi:predicted DCC family thiol-disulfide oxidoreductase YuxK